MCASDETSDEREPGGGRGFLTAANRSGLWPAGPRSQIHTMQLAPESLEVAKEHGDKDEH